MRVSRRLLSLAKPPLETLRITLDFEINELLKHSKLFNQTSPKALLELRDVRPMMNLFSKITDLGGGDLVASDTVRALCFSARDSSFALRRLPFSERAPNRAELFQNLRESALEVCSAIENEKICPDQSVISNLYSLFQKVGPHAGVTLFKRLGALREKAVPGSELAGRLSLLTHEHLVPCIVKSAVPQEELERLAPIIASSDAGKAYLAWGYLKYGDVVKATKIFDELIEHSDRLTPQLLAYLLDAFIGDAPPVLAISIFTTFKSHVPHFMSVTRLIRNIAVAAELPETGPELQFPLKDDSGTNNRKQLITSVYFAYIDRLAVPNDMDVKSTTLELVSCLLADNDITYLKNLLPTLLSTYEKKFETTELLLNVVLSRVSKVEKANTHQDVDKPYRKSDADVEPELKSFICEILAMFESQPNPSVIGCRVQLSALRKLPLSEAEKRADLIWQTRTSLPQPIGSLDLVALGHAIGKTPFFYEQLNALNNSGDGNVHVQIKGRR